MLELLWGLCSVYGTSGDESAVAAYIAGILDTVEGVSYEYTPLGGIIAYKKGGRVPKNRVMLDAHMDEVGLIISDIADDGFLKFTTVGGIDPAVLLGRRVKVGSTLCDGVIGLTPIHLLGEDEKKKLPAVTDMYIDIGAQSKQEAEKLVCLGDNAYFYSEYIEFGDC